ncbi:hypothetical protein P7K49_036782 [Saguinus oedipus]|uniref:Uncharacterized protein n=1 Tax=Saguinus oedipus TaxID=9490 RepID=A0ABQ9TL41_SAGOE|nr:hypothetical protein P7K49_036782 [Saguinus oedipus]
MGGREGNLGHGSCCSHCTAEHPTFNRRNPRKRSPNPPAPQPPQPVCPAPSSAMAKEGQMIEKEAGKEPAEGGGGDGSHRLGDAQEMRAVVLAGFGGLNKLRLSRKAMPEPQDGELKIRVKAWSSIRAFLAFSLFARWALGMGWESRGCCPGRAAERTRSAPSPGSQSLPRPKLGRMQRGGFPKPDLGLLGAGRMLAPSTPGLEDCAAGLSRRGVDG